MGRGLGAWIGVGPERKKQLLDDDDWRKARTPREERRPEKNSSKTHLQKWDLQRVSHEEL